MSIYQVGLELRPIESVRVSEKERATEIVRSERQRIRLRLLHMLDHTGGKSPAPDEDPDRFARRAVGTDDLPLCDIPGCDVGEEWGEW